jgi:hypothetical protein
MKYLYTFVFLIFGYLLHSQCGLTTSYIIGDLDNEQADTTNVSILVEGAINNNLATAQQGVCGVQLKFKHPFMKELFVELISPSGQKITLVGGDIVATNTGLITWDVTFVPCGASPAPDPGFLDQWENDQLWQNLTTYTGQYHPYLGCLESFNTGTVNGTWTIRCIDFEDGGNGTLLDAKIIFCQEQGVSCDECIINPGIIQNDDLVTCQGDGSLNININKTFPNNIFDNNIYDYNNIIFKDSTIIAYAVNPDLRAFSSGRYTICGTQVSKLQSAILPAIGAEFNQQTLSNYFFGLGACAAISDSCMVVEISEAIDPVNIDIYLCKGEQYTIDGQTFDTEGNYSVLIENGACDSLVNLNLTVIDVRATITADRDSISCNGNTIGLEGSNQGTLINDISYRWFTNNGMISGDPTFFIVDAVQEGVYFLEVTGVTPQITCKDTIAKEIFPDRTFPEIIFDNTTITCANDTVLVKANISRATQTIRWSSKDLVDFKENADVIEVWIPGVYYISVLADNGCSVIDSVEIREDKFFQTPMFTSDTLNCKLDSVAINVTLPSDRNFDFAWGNVLDPYKSSNQPFVYQGDVYQVTITDRENGCNGIYDIEVSENRSIPIILDLKVDTIDCNQKSVTPILLVDQIVGEYQWTGPNFNSDESQPTLFIEGNYEVTLISATSFCPVTRQFEVVKDTILPEVTLMVDSLTCLRDSVQIQLTSNVNLVFTTWTGPENFSSNETSPYVKVDGLYFVSLYGNNGCEFRDEILVSYGLDLPDAVLPGDLLKCGMDTINIRVIPKRQDYDYLWSGPGLLENNVMSPRVIVPGLYSVTITDNITGCTAKKVVNIGDDRIYITPQISVAPLDCARDSVQIILTNTDIISIIYTGTNFYSEELSPFVSQVGTYNFILVNDKNCTTVGSIDVVSNDEIPVLEVLVDSIKCNQDSILLDGRSTMVGTMYEWLGPDNFLKSGDQVYAYKGGTYTLKGIAPNGCKSEIMFEVGYDTLAPVFNFLTFPELTCIENTITLSTDFPVSEGTITWSTGLMSPSLNVTEAGDISATATATNQCTTTKTVTITEDKNFPTFTATASVINCKDLLSNIAIVPTSAFTNITWQNTTNPTSIPDGVLTRSTSFPGEYNFEIINQEGCKTEGTVLVETDVLMPIILETKNDTINCNNARVDIGVILQENAIEYLWNGPNIEDFVGSNLLNVSEGGEYYLKITGENYCVTSVLIEVEKDDDIPSYTLFTDTLTCDKGKINIGVNPITTNLTYDWNGPDQFRSASRNPKVFAPGIYIVTVTGENGCFLIDSIMVEQDIVKPSIFIADTLYLPCDTSAITLTVGSDNEILRYNWLFPDGSLVNLASPVTNIKGDYKIQIAGLNGCGSINKSFYIDIDKTPPGFSFQTDTINCYTPNVLISAQSPVSDVTYIWQSPSGTIYSTPSVNTTESGNFLLIVADSKQCKDSIMVTVGLDTIRPVIDVVKSGDIQCEIRIVNLDASGSDMGDLLTANWRTIGGNITSRFSDYEIDLNNAGLYIFELINTFNGCKSEQSFNITETPQQFTLVETEVVPPICDEVQNGSILIIGLNGVSPYSIEFNGANRGEQRLFSNLSTGSYTIVVTDSVGCKQTRNVDVPSGLDLTLGLDDIIEIKFGDSTLLKPNFNIDPTGLATLRWYKRDSLICDGCSELWVRPFLNAYYRLEYSINGACREEAEVLIKVSNDIEKAIPNVFRPLSSGGNDYFYIPQIRGIEKVNKFYVFDRWAENVFSATNVNSGDKSAGWDGTFRGQECQMGVYVVIAELLLVDGSIFNYKGDVLLIR